MRITSLIALAILFVAGLLAYASAWDDVAVVDEDPHIGAGISYLTQRDMRLNPEHPPLVKDLAALPLLTISDLAVPTDHSSWTKDINGQWDFGRAFLFESGNDADRIVRLARVAPLLLMLVLGWFVFRWARERAGAVAGLLALSFFVSSPVVLAHGRFVTTDVPAAAGIFIATYFFLRFLQAPTRKNLFAAGVAFGIAQLLKFSAVLLVPYFFLLAAAWAVLAARKRADEGGEEQDVPTPSFFRSLVRSLGGTTLLMLIGLVVIYAVYIFHVWGYPADRQIRDTAHILASFPNQTAAQAIIAMAGIDVFRPLAQYLLGVAMVVQRATGGNTTFFLGEVSATGWASYFPLVYLIKTPLAFHILTVVAALTGFTVLARQTRRFSVLFREHFSEFAALLFLAIYWYTSLTSNLNIGVRHLLPTFPFLFVLVAQGTAAFLSAPVRRIAAFRGTFGNDALAFIFRSSFAGLLLLWMIAAGMLAWPHYLSSFNEVAVFRGGGAAWAVDSNLDWGQDLKRLARYIERRSIDRIAVDYFGWSPPGYYITTAEVIPWSADKGQPTGWFAVSATYKQQACAQPAAGFQGNTTGYCFLERYQPEAVIGGSIYVYKLP